MHCESKALFTFFGYTRRMATDLPKKVKKHFACTDVGKGREVGAGSFIFRTLATFATIQLRYLG